MREGGSQYGAPPQEMSPFAPAGMGTRTQVLGIPAPEQLQQPQQQQQQPCSLAEAASPISSRPPMGTGNFAELAPAASEGFPDEDAVLAAAEDEGERGGASSNRWPREETLALLRIRSEMDVTFREATLKGPLWEDVSRKLAELGYKRSARKCKEKFENVRKYYKRTKDGRVGRQDGKSYRFFNQLEALRSSSGATTATAAAATSPASSSAPAASTPHPPSSSIDMVGSSVRLQPTPLNAIPLSIGTPHHVVPEPMALAGTPPPGISYPPGGIIFSSNNSSSASVSEEDTEEGLPKEPRKRKRREGSRAIGVGTNRKMMAFFDDLMKQVMERQEAMQHKFQEMIEKREQDRMIREEVWRREEMARLNREHEMMAQERKLSASRDTTIMAFLQKMTEQTVPDPVPPPIPAVMRTHPVPQQRAPPAPVPSASPTPRQPQPLQPQAQQHSIHSLDTGTVRIHTSPLDVVPLSSTEVEEVASASGGSRMDPASSRWSKAEVLTLIRLRSGIESRYEEAGPKGPLWEEIALGMRRIGYSRSAKRCKEKWENINKYFKKVKDSNRKRPEDAKTYPYFHELDALYRKKILGPPDSSLGNHMTKQELETSPAPVPSTASPPQPTPSQQPQVEAQGRNNVKGSNTNINVNKNCGNSGNGVPTRNDLLEEGASNDETVKEPEDIVNGLMDQQRQQQCASMDDDYDKMEETDSDVMDQEQDSGNDGNDEKLKMAYKIEYQQPSGVNATSSGGGNQSTAAATVAAATAGSFMAMVQ